MQVSPAILARLKAALPPGRALESEADTDPFVRDWRGRYRGATPLVLQPGSTAEVAAIVAICAETGTPVVPQGGNTGMVAGGIPRAEGEDVVLSLSRMKRIRDLDPANHTMTVEAGCVLADVQAAAREAGRLFPLSLAAEGSCQIGGNLSTNAGGTAVLRYGNARDLVLGLEVVLPDGSVWDGLRALRKDNSGFDLKQVFLGAEGSLGIITAAVIKLFPLPAEVVTALVTLPEPADATRLLSRLREASGDAVVTFEYINRNCLDLVLEHIPGTADPLGPRFAHYALVELAAGSGGARVARCWRTCSRRAWIRDGSWTRRSPRAKRSPRNCGNSARAFRKRPGPTEDASRTTCPCRYRGSQSCSSAAPPCAKTPSGERG